MMDTKRHAVRSEDGFTVVELLVAVVILLIVVTAVIGGIMFAGQSARATARSSDAMSLANQQIEMARNLPFDEVATIDPSNGLPAGKIPGVQTVGPYTVTTDVSYGTYGAIPAARYKDVHVTVTWSDPTTGSIEMTTSVAGASGTQDYNFGIVTLSVVNENVPAQPMSGVRVNLTDCNGRVYSVITGSTGVARFEYVPSGDISFVSTKSGYAIDAPVDPTCVANTTTNYGPVVAHEGQVGVVRLLAPNGTRVSGATISLDNGPNAPSDKTTNSSGEAYWWGSLITGTYQVGVTHSLYQLNGTEYLTVDQDDVLKVITLGIKPCTVTATRSSKGTIYVWNADGTFNTSKATSSSSPYRATFTLTPPTVSPTVYYFTRTNAFATTNKLTVTAGQTASITVN